MERQSFLNIWKKKIWFFVQCMEPKADEKVDEKTDEKADEKAGQEQPDTTDMPELESEESAEQRRNQEGQRLKILKKRSNAR